VRLVATQLNENQSHADPVNDQKEKVSFSHFLQAKCLHCPCASITMPGAGCGTNFLLHPIFSVNLGNRSGFNGFHTNDSFFQPHSWSLFPIAQSVASHTVHLLSTQHEMNQKPHITHTHFPDRHSERTRWQHSSAGNFSSTNVAWDQVIAPLTLRTTLACSPF
jgi:hypothetical protein